MDSRQQFEEWYAEESKDWPPAITVCCKETMRGTWQASRSAIKVELPDAFWPGYVEEDEPGLCISTHLYTIEQITEALAEQGITAS